MDANVFRVHHVNKLLTAPRRSRRKLGQARAHGRRQPHKLGTEQSRDRCFSNSYFHTYAYNARISRWHDMAKKYFSVTDIPSSVLNEKFAVNYVRLVTFKRLCLEMFDE